MEWMRRSVWCVGLVLAVLMASARGVRAANGGDADARCAQPSAGQGPVVGSEDEATAPPLRVEYQDGLRVSTVDGSFTLVLDGTSQMDFRYGRVGANERSTFLIRRAQLGAAGTFERLIEWRVKYEMASIEAGTTPRRVALEETYVGLRLRRWAVLRMGLLKVPLESEFTKTAHRSLDFAERSWASRISPGRDMGVQVAGDVGTGQLDYTLGFFNGASNDSAGKATHDSNSAKDWAGQLRLHPWACAQKPALRGLQLSAGFTSGGNDGDPITAFVSQETDVKVVVPAPEVVGSGRRERWAVDGQWLAGPVGLKAEYAAMDNDLARGATRGRVRLQAYYASVTWLVTGERKVVDIIRPKRPVGRGRGWGSVELGARLSGFLVDESSHAQGADAQLVDFGQSARRATSVALGVTWRPHALARVMLNYVSDRFSEPLARVQDDMPVRRAQAWLLRLEGDF
jgi:phosphate-selective porin OprO and OprP